MKTKFRHNTEITAFVIALILSTAACDGGGVNNSMPNTSISIEAQNTSSVVVEGVTFDLKYAYYVVSSDPNNDYLGAFLVLGDRDDYCTQMQNGYQVANANYMSVFLQQFEPGFDGNLNVWAPNGPGTYVIDNPDEYGPSASVEFLALDANCDNIFVEKDPNSQMPYAASTGAVTITQYTTPGASDMYATFDAFMGPNDIPINGAFNAVYCPVTPAQFQNTNVTCRPH